MAEPIRILHVLGNLNKGGAESRIMDIYRAIDRSRVQFDFMVHTDKPGFFDSEIKSLGGRIYHEVPRFRIINFVQYRRAWLRFFATHPYNCIHIHTYNTALPILMAAKRAGILGRICHSHSSSSTGIARKLMVRVSRKHIRKLATHRFAVSNLAGQHVFGHDFQVKPNAFDVLLFRYDEDKRSAMRQELGLQDSFLLGAVARFHEVKNHTFMLDVLAELKKTVPNAHLLLVGDGPLQTKIETRAANLGLAESVTFLGLRNDIPALLAAMDVFLMPSFHEGFPGAALEAQASGLLTLLSSAITPEVGVVPDITVYLSINDGVYPWVDKILCYVKKPLTRRGTTEEIIAAGYGIRDVVRWYEGFYVGISPESYDTMYN